MANERFHIEFDEYGRIHSRDPRLTEYLLRAIQINGRLEFLVDSKVRPAVDKLGAWGGGPNGKWCPEPQNTLCPPGPNDPTGCANMMCDCPYRISYEDKVTQQFENLRDDVREGGRGERPRL